jgi:hypothetical protein
MDEMSLSPVPLAEQPSVLYPVDADVAVSQTLRSGGLPSADYLTYSANITNPTDQFIQAASLQNTINNTMQSSAPPPSESFTTSGGQNYTIGNVGQSGFTLLNTTRTTIVNDMPMTITGAPSDIYQLNASAPDYNSLQAVSGSVTPSPQPSLDSSRFNAPAGTFANEVASFPLSPNVEDRTFAGAPNIQSGSIFAGVGRAWSYFQHSILHL